MSTIGTEPTPGQAGPVNSDNTGEVGKPDDPVDLGYDPENSYSHTEGEDDVVTPKGQPPKLEEPKIDAETEAAWEQIIKEFKQSNDKTFSGNISEALQIFTKKPLAKIITLLENKKGDLLKLGFSESQIDGLIALADPDDEGNSLPSLHSASARVNAEAQGDKTPGELFDAFVDVVEKYSAIKSIPSDLQGELDADFIALIKKTGNPHQPLDIDSATTLLVEIQTKLQNNRIVFDQQTIKIGQVEKQQTHERQLNKIMESIEKTKDSKKSALVSKIFGWIGVVLLSVVTAVAAVFSGGAAVGLMGAALAITVTMMVSQEAGSTWMMDIFGDSEESKIGAMVFWTALIVVLSLGSAAAGGGASAGSTAASTASNLGGAGASGAASTAAAGSSAAAAAGSTGAVVSATASNTAATVAASTARLTNFATNLSRALNLVNGAASIAEGSSSIVSTSYSYDADILRAEITEERAFLLRIQQKIDDATESLQTAIDELQAGFTVAASIISANHETKTTLSRNLRA